MRPCSEWSGTSVFYYLRRGSRLLSSRLLLLLLLLLVGHPEQGWRCPAQDLDEIVGLGISDERRDPQVELLRDRAARRSRCRFSTCGHHAPPFNSNIQCSMKPDEIGVVNMAVTGTGFFLDAISC